MRKLSKTKEASSTTRKDANTDNLHENKPTSHDKSIKIVKFPDDLEETKLAINRNIDLQHIGPKPSESLRSTGLRENCHASQKMNN